jgi:1-acyl-sn-glycerol-3-phosphate acyltransferase
MRHFRAIFKIIFLLAITFRYLIPLLIHQWVKGIDYKRALHQRYKWCNGIMGVLGIRIDEQGQPPDLVAIYINNHRSYFDPVVALRYIRAFPIAKAEVSKWPLIGFAARATGIIFVKREDKTSRRLTREAIVESIGTEKSILIYPEGTTLGVPTTGEFRPGTFQIAAAEGIPMVPMAIEYRDKSDYWLGKATFVPHMYRFLGKKETHIKFRIGEPIVSHSAAELKTKIQRWIDEQLIDMQREWEEI